ncbi:MAG: hypothetical protein KDA75_15340 [Planctomycetaceae bacterium]|nr:hypothetical protein [Planctomycetaceae bacterium]
MMRKTLLLLSFGLAAAGLPRTAAAQMWFESDYLFWGRTNGSSQDYITGGAASDDADFGFASGYRLILGGGVGNYEVEGIFSQINGWNGDGTSGLVLPVAFDGNAANAIVFPGGATTLALNSGLALAASQAAELSEAEFLTAGSIVTHSYSSNLRDIQLNFGSHRDLNWFRWGIGYRNVLINENGGAGIFGTFDALDIDDAAGPGDPNNDPNNGLATGSLAAAGFTSLRGTGGFDSINPLVPSADTISMIMTGTTENRLDGVQMMFGVSGSPHEVVTLEGFLRFGLFYNRINGSASELLVGGGDDDSVYFRTLGDSTAKASFGINPGFRSQINITDYIALTAGYELLILTGIGLGPDQLGQVQQNLLGVPSYKVDADGLFVGHGGNVGLEIRW